MFHSGERKKGFLGSLSKANRTILWREMKENAAAYAFLSPFMIIFAIFLLFPVLFSFYISFFDWPGAGPRTFVGLRNYSLLLADPEFHIAFWNTLIVGVIHVISATFLALLLAVMLDRAWLGLKFFWQPVIFIPSVTATVVIALVFQGLLGLENGAVNQFLGLFGIPPIQWLGSTIWAKWSLVLVVDWRWTGYSAVILLAGLKMIKRDVYDAATVDGANWWQQLVFITIPLLRPILLFVSITSTIGILQMFAEPFILTPETAPTLGLYVYQVAFEYFSFGYGSAIAWFITVFVAVLAYLQLRAFGQEMDV